MNEVQQYNTKDRQIKAIWFLVLIYFLVHPTLHNEIITGIVWKLGIICLGIITLSKIRVLERKSFIFILILIASMLIGSINAGIIFDLNKCFSIMAFLNLLFFVEKSDAIKISPKAVNYIYWVAVLISALFEIYIFTGIANKVTTDSVTWFCQYYVFNLDNSNIAGIYLYGLFCLILINFERKKELKLVNVIMLMILFYMIWKTEARTCIVATVFVTFVSVFYKNKMIPRKIIVSCFLFPVVFMFTYLWLFNSGFNDIAIGDKMLFSGRQETFVTYLNFIQTPIGIFFGNIGEVTFSNAHNGPLAIFCSTGLLGCFVFYYIFIKQVIRANKRASSSINYIAIICILGFIIQTSGEAAILLGGFPGAPFICTFFLLARGNY